MSDCVAALATVIAVFVMLRAERKDMAKVSDLARIDARIDALDAKLVSRIEVLDTRIGSRIDALDSKIGSRIEALDSNVTARLDTVVLELGKTFGRPAN